MNFCSNCGQPVVLRVPDGDDRSRYVCDACGTVHYSNPKMVVGTIPVLDGRILLCRRAIEPRYGKWTLPAGFMEDGETVEAGARRETLEEAGAEVKSLSPFAMFSLPFVSQVYLMFRAELVSPKFAPGHESLAVKMVEEAEIPWDEIAFPVIEETLHRYLADRRSGEFDFHAGVISRRI